MLSSYLAPQLLVRRPTWTDQVRNELVRQMPSGEVRLRAVARSLAISDRTLYRRLADEDASFRALLDEIRQQLAAELIEDRELSVHQISHRLGFTSARAFHRAHLRWYGTTPRGQARRG